MDKIVHCGTIEYDYTETKSNNIKKVYNNLVNEIIKDIKEKTKNFTKWILQTDHYPFGYDCPTTIYFDGKENVFPFALLSRRTNALSFGLNLSNKHQLTATRI